MGSSIKTLLTHPKPGASGKGFVIEQALMAQPHDEAFFRATHQDAEIDLILRRDDTLFSIECKRTDAPRITPSIRIALDDLGPQQIIVLYPGSKRFAMGNAVDAVPLRELSTL